MPLVSVGNPSPKCGIILTAVGRWIIRLLARNRSIGTSLTTANNYGNGGKQLGFIFSQEVFRRVTSSFRYHLKNISGCLRTCGNIRTIRRVVGCRL